MLNIGLVGANGRMGRAIVEQIRNKNNEYNLKCAIVANMDNIASEVKEVAQVYAQDITMLGGVDVVVDFSAPKSSLVILPFCIEKKLPIVIGTTGFNAKDELFIKECAKNIPIVFAPNTSVSVNMLYKLVAIVSARLTNFDVEITEAHHRYKKDSPSGTALKMGKVVAESRGVNFEQKAKFARYGNNEVRQDDEIGFSVIRGGDIVGMHDIQFIANGEILSIKSQINNRASFANGALLATKFVANQISGLFDMYDVLGI